MLELICGMRGFSDAWNQEKKEYTKPYKRKLASLVSLSVKQTLGRARFNGNPIHLLKLTFLLILFVES